MSDPIAEILAVLVLTGLAILLGLVAAASLSAWRYRGGWLFAVGAATAWVAVGFILARLWRYAT